MSLRVFDSFGELVEFVQSGTGYETWFEETGKTTEDFIVIYLLSSNAVKADNGAFDANLQLQLTFFTKNKANVLAIDNFMKKEFGSSCTFSFQVGGERRQAIYELEVFISGEIQKNGSGD